jgi:hypothetical protein
MELEVCFPDTKELGDEATLDDDRFEGEEGLKVPIKLVLALGAMWIKQSRTVTSPVRGTSRILFSK